MTLRGKRVFLKDELKKGSKQLKSWLNPTLQILVRLNKLKILHVKQAPIGNFQLRNYQ
jgi:hypothetical protein